MEKIEELLNRYLNEMLVQIIISNPRTRAEAAKISLRPVLLKNKLVFQASAQQNKKVFHKNYTVSDTVAEVLQ